MPRKSEATPLLGAPASPPASAERNTTAGEDASAPSLDSLPYTVRAEARRRAQACMAVWRLMETGCMQVYAIDYVARYRSLSPCTLRNWWIKVRALPQSAWAQTLASQRGMHTKNERAAFSEEALDFLKEDYTRTGASCVRACFDRLLRIAPSKGWQVPSYRTAVRRLEAFDWTTVALASGEDRNHDV